MSGDPYLVSTDLVNSYPRPSVTESWVRTIIALSLAYCIIITSYFIIITSSLEECIFLTNTAHCLDLFPILFHLIISLTSLRQPG